MISTFINTQFTSFNRFFALLILIATCSIGGYSQISSADTFYGPPYFNNDAYFSNPPFSTVEEVVSDWWAKYQVRWYWAFPGCSYIQTNYPDGAQSGWFASVTLQGTCGGGDGIHGTAYGYNPIKNNGAPQICTGNPINPAIGNKFQSESDFSTSVVNGLIFERYYGSVASTPTANLGLRWRHFYDRSVFLASQNGISSASVSRPDGKIYRYLLQGSAWVPELDLRSTSLARVLDVGGVPIGWKYQTDNDVIEFYDNDGKLVSLSFPTGIVHALTYSDGTQGQNGGFILDANGVPTASALPAGLLIRIADNRGRTLVIGYDTAKRLVKIVDPAGGQYIYKYDTNNNLISVTYPDTKTRTYVYNESTNTSGVNLPSALTGIIDENNYRFATWKYDTQGRAISSEHDLPGNVPVEKVSIAYTTDTNGAVTSSAVTDALNTTRTYSFTNVLGVVKNTGVSQPCSSGCGAASATTYDANGNIASRTDFNGNVTNYLYDLTRNLETSRTEAYGTPQARTITTQWHAVYRLPTLITEPGKTTAFNYDTSGNLLSKTITDTALSKSRTWTWTYNALGQVLTANGPRTDVSDVTTYTYYLSASNVAGSVHSLGDLATVTNAANQITSITNYDLNGRPLSITDPNGIVTTLTYWPRGWLKSRTVNGAQTTSYDYDGVGQLVKVTLPDGSYLSYTYDTAHRLTDITDNAGNKTHYTLDAMGNRLQEDTKDPSSNILKTRSRIFDALNRLQKDIGGTSPSTQITQYSYDNNGNLKTITDPLNHTTTNGYDALNRLITVTDPANGVATTTYNALDQVTQVKDPRLVTTNYTIDALGNVTLTQSPDSGNTQAVYDLAGNVIQKTDARGIVSNYTYDALNRVTSITYPANTAENVSFTYDSVANGNKGKGRLTGYSNDGGATVLTYDAYGNITLQTEMIGGQIYTTAYKYDSANRVSQITYPSGRIVFYTRNTLGQIIKVQTKDSATATTVTMVSSASYEPFGPLKALTYANGVTTTFMHDADYRVSRITTTSTPKWDFVYSYDAAGNITGITDQVSTNSKTFGYDNLNRVTSDTNNTGVWTFQYDANGNRTQRVWVNTSNVTNTQTLTFGTTSNRLTKNNTATVIEDAAGNITGNGLTQAYNAANRLLKVSSGSTVNSGFSYNAIGQRTQKTQISKPVQFHYGRNGELLGMLSVNSDGTNYLRVEYMWLNDTPIVQVWTVYGTNNTVSSRRILAVHPDHLNTPRAMSDANKKMVWRWDGDAYGSQKPNENPDGDGTVDTLNLRFPGQFYDAETGYYYNVNRDYDPGTGRYLESDPIGLTGGLNTYGYALQNPISYIDPLGLSSTMTWPARLGIAGTAAASDGPLPIGDLVAAGLIVEGIYEVCKDKTCPPCKTVSGRVVPVGTVAYRPLDIIPDDVKQHGVYGSHHNIFIAKQYPAPKCDCFWQKQSYVLKPDQLPAGAIPIEPFAN